MNRRAVIALRALYEEALARKGTRFTGMFVGKDDGTWEYWPKMRIGWQGTWDWEAAIGFSLKNDGRNMSVEGATEHHPGFRKALNDIVRAYPEVREFLVEFDGPYLKVADLVDKDTGQRFDWKRTTFYHGTSSVAAETILKTGLTPRGSGAAVYGSASSAKEGRRDAVYLTTQEGTAKFAAHDAARAHKGYPVLLAVSGLDGSDMVPDEDSDEATAEASVTRIGSCAHVGPIPSRHIRLYATLKAGDAAWALT